MDTPADTPLPPPAAVRAPAAGPPPDPPAAALSSAGHAGPPPAESVPIRPRLPAPSLVLPAAEGRLLAALPCPPQLRNYRPVPTRSPQRRRRTAPAAAPVATPAGLVGADAAAVALDLPAPVVRRMALTRPGLLPVPPAVVVDGEPFFRPDLLPRP